MKSPIRLEMDAKVAVLTIDRNERRNSLDNDAIDAFLAALPGYRMEARQGRTILFRPPLDRKFHVTGGRWVSTARQYVFPDNDLTPFAPALEVIEVPGDHDSMVLEPNVRVLAARLREAIAALPDTPAPFAQAAE